MSGLHNLLNQAKLILERINVSRMESRLRGEQFNIFHVSGVNHYETIHSAVIAEFLNPDGSHGQGDTYLKEFLSTIGNNEFLNAFDTSKASVATESQTADGRLDILITNTKGQAVIIENKIYADDQWEQLKRYNDFALNKYRSGNYAILYLTLWGDEASEQSGKGVDYTCISYKDTVLKWLERCIQISAQKPLIRETMIQYANLIKELTNQTMDTKSKNELLKLMVDNAEVVAEIYNNQGDYIKYVWENRIRPRLQEMANKKELLYEDYNMTCQNPDGKSFTFRSSNWQYTAIRFMSERKSDIRDLYYGIVSLDGKTPKPQQKLDVFQDSPNVFWPYGSAYMDSFRHWDMNTLAYMVNHMDKFVDYIKEKIEMILDELDRKGIQLE